MKASDCKFSKEHQWVFAEGNTGIIGISDFAQKSLGDIVFVDLPEEGTVLSAGKVFSSVESVKTVSDIYAPVSGKIIAVNEELNDAPELINKDAYKHWIVKVEMADAGELNALMDEAAYGALCKKGE